MRMLGTEVASGGQRRRIARIVFSTVVRVFGNVSLFLTGKHCYLERARFMQQTLMA